MSDTAPPAVGSPALAAADALAEIAALRAALAEAEALPGAISHELRSPMGALLILAMLLGKDEAGALDPRQQDLLRRLADCTRGMVTLLERLSQLTQVCRHVLAPVRTDLRAEVEAAFAGQLLAHRGTPPVLKLGSLPDVTADPTLLRVLLGELLGNAIQASATRAAPCLEVGGTAGPAEVTFFVRDNGAGFNEAQRRRLFTVFGRIHSQATGPGVGVGLALVRHVAARHGGRAWAQGEQGVGATFHVALPRDPLAQVASAARPAE